MKGHFTSGNVFNMIIMPVWIGCPSRLLGEWFYARTNSHTAFTWHWNEFCTGMKTSLLYRDWVNSLGYEILFWYHVNKINIGQQDETGMNSKQNESCAGVVKTHSEWFFDHALVLCYGSFEQNCQLGSNASPLSDLFFSPSPPPPHFPLPLQLNIDRCIWGCWRVVTVLPFHINLIDSNKYHCCFLAWI